MTTVRTPVPETRMTSLGFTVVFRAWLVLAAATAGRINLLGP